jgi:cyclopropane fatty-acyl-phospholipid synthase-like methyltransferase
MGCGNGSLMVHVVRWAPAQLDGIDLGSSCDSARANLAACGARNWSVQQADLVAFAGPGYDVVYSIGVLHHLKVRGGLRVGGAQHAPGGRFHCWVYAREGNAS